MTNSLAFPGSDGVFMLADDAVATIDGSDALRFAQSQFTNNVEVLADGAWQWSGWLTPKGRLVAFFALVRLAEDRVALVLPAAGARALVERLQRFVFRSKVRLVAEAALRPFGCFGPVSASGALAQWALPDPAPLARTLLLADAGLGGGAEPAAADGHIAAWRRADLALGVPYIAPGTPASEQFVPQWLSLQRLQAFSVGKGCYPGQEIVARMHFLGQSKREAVRLGGLGVLPAPMSKVQDGAGRTIGELVWGVDDAGHWQAQAVVATEQRDAIAAVVTESGPPIAAQVIADAASTPTP